MNTAKSPVTHESFVSAVAALAIAQITDPEARAKLESIKLVYGAGQSGLRGVTYFNKWRKPGDEAQPAPFVEVCAFGQESWVQVAGTTIHELGHVLAGWEAGHKRPWHDACERLGLRCLKAAGTNYTLANFAPALRLAIAALPRPNEGAPVDSLAGMFAGLLGVAGGIAGGMVRKLKPCGAGMGTRGGKSRGTGSGSRLRLWTCGCGCKVRVASDTFEATHDPCGTSFAKA
jgi:hypothetical protein